MDGSDSVANQVFSGMGRGKGNELSLILVTLQPIPSQPGGDLLETFGCVEGG